MNISPQNIIGKCNYKCDYSFDYPTSSSTAINGGTMLTLSYDQSSNSVTYNNIKYDVISCYIYSPSLHLYNNLEANGEFIIEHAPSTGGNPLYICIPISTNGISNNASNTLTEIINAVSTSAPSQGESVSQGINDFTLNDFVFLKEFYTYSTAQMDVVAFGIINSIFISQDSLSLLQKSIIKGSSTMFPSGPDLFISSGIPTKGNGINGNEIYIDCQPTDESEEQVTITTINSIPEPFDINTIYKNPIFIFLCSLIIFIVIIYGTNKLLGAFSGSSNE